MKMRTECFLFSSMLLILIFICLFFSNQNNLIGNYSINHETSTYSGNQLILFQDDPPWGDDDPPWGDGDPPWGGGERPDGERPEGGPPGGGRGGPGGEEGDSESEEDATLSSRFILFMEVIAILISIILPTIAIIAYQRRLESNAIIINQLGSRRRLDEDDTEAYLDWGYSAEKQIPDWAYKIIRKRFRNANITEGKITYKHLPKKVKKKRIAYCTYQQVNNRFYDVQAYRLRKYIFKRGRLAMKEVKNKIKTSYLVKNDPRTKKLRHFRLQMEDEGDLNKDNDIDLIRQLLNKKKDSNQ